jgi:hypothetical protein
MVGSSAVDILLDASGHSLRAGHCGAIGKLLSTLLIVATADLRKG